MMIVYLANVRFNKAVIHWITYRNKNSRRVIRSYRKIKDQKNRKGEKGNNAQRQYQSI